MITNRIKIVAAIGSVLVSVALVSCTANVSQPTAEVVQTPTSSPSATPDNETNEWDSSLTSAVSTLDEAASQATLVVRGTAGASRVEMIADTPFTVTTVAVKDTVAGSSASSVEVRQFGDAHNASGDLASLLQSGKDYLLYLEPFELEQGHPLAQYVIVGGTAAWAETSDPEEFDLQAHESELPAVVTESEIEASAE